MDFYVKLWFANTNVIDLCRVLKIEKYVLHKVWIEEYVSKNMLFCIDTVIYSVPHIWSVDVCRVYKDQQLKKKVLYLIKSFFWVKTLFWLNSVTHSPKFSD